MAKAKKEVTELEMAVQLLPINQKNKLFLRLVKKDKILSQKLVFEQLGDAQDKENRSQIVRTYIEDYIHPDYLYSETPGEIMMLMRSMNGRIAEHVKITQDKIGEIELTILVMRQVLTHFETSLRKYPQRAVTFAPYFVKKAGFVLQKISKLHEDYHMEYRENLTKILDFI